MGGNALWWEGHRMPQLQLLVSHYTGHVLTSVE